MGCRGLWDLYIHGKRYRLCHPRGRITYPDDIFTLQTLREPLDKPDFLEQWEVVPCPSPLNTSLDYVYTVDHDAGLFTISMWGELNGSLAPAVTLFDLTEIYNATGVSLEKVRQESQFSFRDNVIETEEIESKLLVLERLDIQLGMPTPLNELQERFFADFVFQWRFYIDDPLTWTYSSSAFKIFCIAVLRLAAWDFEVVFDDPNAELPISFKSIPSWSYSKADIYWFHGYLVVLQEDIRSASMIENAISQAKAYTDNLDTRHDIVHLILLSPHHVIFA
ncbi:hypothetical protein PVAR5_7220 [Paecilomyces variotii No. 5]|uniref:Uncharacterized protein n=1 Tax=Byssochlamys spectabilis (strain No. 5 / NBRC 109023) TaxID=1356009 RepID=V5G948_BYSSN|nr:hypothetical protein PVAR5_7220 [Paecilomyces variotii No. 5]